MLQASVIISTCMTMRHLASVLLTPHLHSFFFHRCSRHALDFLSIRNSSAPKLAPDSFLPAIHGLSSLSSPALTSPHAQCKFHPLTHMLAPHPCPAETLPRFGHRGWPHSQPPLCKKGLGPHDPFCRSLLPPGRALLPSHFPVSDWQQRIKGRSWGSSTSSKVPESLDHPTEGDLPPHEGTTT